MREVEDPEVAQDPQAEGADPDRSAGRRGQPVDQPGPGPFGRHQRQDDRPRQGGDQQQAEPGPSASESEDVSSASFLGHSLRVRTARPRPARRPGLRNSRAPAPPPGGDRARRTIPHRADLHNRNLGDFPVASAPSAALASPGAALPSTRDPGRDRPTARGRPDEPTSRSASPPPWPSWRSWPPSGLADDLPRVVEASTPSPWPRRSAGSPRRSTSSASRSRPRPGPGSTRPWRRPEPAAMVRSIQEVLDPLCLAGVTINPEGRVGVVQGPAPAVLVQHGWRLFLVKVHNQAGVTAELRVTSPNAAPAGPALDQRRQARPAPDAAGGRRPLDGPGHGRRPPAQPDALGPPARIPPDPGLQPGRRPPRGQAPLRRRPGDAGPGLPGRPGRPVHVRARRLRHAGRPRLRRQADHRLVPLPRRAGPGLPLADPPAGARLLVPPAGLPEVGRVGRAGPRDVHRRGDPRAGVRGPEADDRGPEGGERIASRSS